VSEADPHSPTAAGPAPEEVPGTVHAPVGSGLLDGAPAGAPPQPGADRPEILVGAAFAGGLLAAIILKRLGGD